MCVCVCVCSSKDEGEAVCEKNKIILNKLGARALSTLATLLAWRLLIHFPFQPARERFITIYYLLPAHRLCRLFGKGTR